MLLKIVKNGTRNSWTGTIPKEFNFEKWKQIIQIVRNQLIFENSNSKTVRKKLIEFTKNPQDFKNITHVNFPIPHWEVENPFGLNC